MTDTRSHASNVVPEKWWIGLAAGLVVSSVLTIIVVVWEWLENPGGIFRGASGTNWEFVFETAVSWFVPTFINVAVVASVIHLAWGWIIKRRGAGR